MACEKKRKKKNWDQWEDRYRGCLAVKRAGKTRHERGKRGERGMRQPCDPIPNHRLAELTGMFFCYSSNSSPFNTPLKAELNGKHKAVCSPSLTISSQKENRRPPSCLNLSPSIPLGSPTGPSEQSLGCPPAEAGMPPQF